jgi:protein-S-isoprenylcysteine O-methyltransferase Ste14
MIKKIGKFLFRYRNMLAPLLFILAAVVGRPSYPLGRADLNIALDIIGVLVGLSGQALRVVTIGYQYIKRGGQDRQVYANTLVEGGVFAHCRNPLYVGNILMAVGLALIMHSLVFYLIFVPLVVFAYICIVAAEEDFLRAKFGPEYEAYCRRVNRWLPRWKGWKRSTAGMSFNWRRVLLKEYNTFFMYIATLAAAEIWSRYRVAGPSALPGSALVIAALALWLALYVLVRSLKKTGAVKV